MKKLLVVLLCLAMVFAFAACSQDPVEPDDTENPDDVVTEDDDWAYVEAKGKLVIGITLFQPMNYYDDNNVLTGFETEFAQAVCEKLGVEPEFVVIDWDNKELELSAKKIDCIWNGLTVTEERRANMDFSQSYVRNKQVAVIKAENADTYTDAASMADARFVAESGSAGATAVASEEAWANAAYTDVASQADALLEVKAGTADVAVIDYVMANSSVGEGTSYADLMLLDLDLTPEEYAIGFRVGSNITEKVNAIIDELVADGTLAAIAAKYNMSDVLLFNQVDDNAADEDAAVE